MAKKNHGELDLSLTGSQVLSARSNRPSARRPSSSGGRMSDSTSNAVSQGAESHRRLNSTSNLTPKIRPATDTGAFSAPRTRGVSDEFLAFFENQGAKPKVRNTTAALRKDFSQSKVTKSPLFPGSTSSTPRSARSKKTNTSNSNVSRHSIFRPDSALSVSTNGGDGDSTAHNTPLSTARSNGSVAERISSSFLTPRDNDQLNPMNNEVEMAALRSSAYPDAADVIHNRVSVQSTSSPRLSQTKAATSNQKDLNAANNMLPQGEMRRHHKLELKTMQNSYQNATYNVNKAPVNELQSGSRPPVTRNQTEDYIKTVNMSACIIQHAFRRFVRQRKALRASEAAMKRLLAQKKEEIMHSQQEQDVMSENKSLNRQRIREEKAKQARLAAINELNKRREDQKKQAEEVTKAEIERLKKSGKVGSRKFVTKSVAQRSKASKNARMEAVQTDDTHDEDDTRLVQRGEPSVSQQRVSQSVEVSDEVDVVPPTPSQVGTHTTLDDLLSTLKLLEEDEQLPSPPESKIQAWTDPESGGEGQASERASSAGGGRLSQTSDGRQGLSNEKLKSILSFLDEVETKDKLDSIDQSVESLHVGAAAEPLPGLLVPSAEELEQMEQASAAASEVTNTVLKQRLQIDEKNRTVQMLQKALNQQRELTIRHARETEKEMNKRLDVQKSEYEEAVQRHLNFIDQLIDDKKMLSEKCESLVTELKQIEKKYSERLTNMQQTHDRELAKVKEMITAQERVKREKWIEEKTKKIKDLTVKGLEPEIQRLIAKHKSELKKLKAIHEAELLQSDERAGQRYVSMTEELRDQLAKEKESACQRERELAAQRYEKQLQAEEEAYQQARRRLYQEIQDEKERLSQQATRQRQEMDKLQQKLEETHTTSSDIMRRDYEKIRQEQDERHKTELSELKERLNAEKEAWEQNYMKKQEAWLVAKEREMKETVRQERDREIELVIGRLEEDGVQAREECERAAESRIKRIRDKYEGELLELERSERQALEKYNHMKAELLEAQGEAERLRVVNKQKEQEVEDTKKLSEKLHRERDHVQDVVRQEFADKLVATEEENKKVKQDMAELKSRHKAEIERMKQEIEVVNKAKQEEMDAVHTRVKQAIAKKEEVVSQVKQQYQAALKRADHLEGLLEQQRKQLVGSKK